MGMRRIPEKMARMKMRKMMRKAMRRQRRKAARMRVMKRMMPPTAKMTMRQRKTMQMQR